MISPRFCPLCGAANEALNMYCFSCGQPFAPPKLPARLTRRKLLVLIGAGVLAGGVVYGGTYYLTEKTSPPANFITSVEHQGPVYSIAWSTTNTVLTAYLISASADKTVQLVDMDIELDDYGIGTSASYTYTGHKGGVNSVACSPDGTRFASASSDGTVKITQIVITSNDVTVSPPGRTVTGGHDVLTYTGHKAAVHAVAWSLDGTHIASASSDGIVQVWDARTGKTIITKNQEGASYAVAWSPDSKQIVSGGAQKKVLVWDATDGHVISTYQRHQGVVFGLAWSPDGKYIASASADATVQVWNATNGNEMLTYRGHKAAVRSVDWSSYGAIASASADATVQVWNATDASSIYTYHGHSAAVNTVSWPWSSRDFGVASGSINGQTIASGSDDNTVQVWSIPSGPS